jgi:hypothetical protein
MMIACGWVWLGRYADYHFSSDSCRIVRHRAIINSFLATPGAPGCVPLGPLFRFWFIYGPRNNVSWPLIDQMGGSFLRCTALNKRVYQLQLKGQCQEIFNSASITFSSFFNGLSPYVVDETGKGTKVAIISVNFRISSKGRNSSWN